MPTSQLVYASAARALFTRTELQQLLQQARTKNAGLDVTGLLLHRRGSFLQVLEGPQEAVRALFATIAADPRHESVNELLCRPIDARNFADWRMGFADFTAGSRALPGFVDYFDTHSSFLDLQGDTTTVAAILDGFRDGHWQRLVQAA